MAQSPVRHRWLLFRLLKCTVAELTSEKCPVPVKRIGVPDQWAPTGSEAWLMDHWGISVDDIVAAAHDLRS